MKLNNQISMFESIDAESLLPIDKQKFRRALRRGSNFTEGKKRIKENAVKLNKQDFIDFLKKEYGIGGFSFENGFIDFNGKGFVISEERFTKETKYSWTQVADELLDLINTNAY